MKIKNLFLILVSALLIAGCAARTWKVSAVNPAEFSQHPLLFEVAYDFDCVMRGTILADKVWHFKKGQRFQPVDLGGRTLNLRISRGQAWQGQQGKAVLPKNIVGLNFHTLIAKIKGSSILYIPVNPNGQLSSEDFHVIQYLKGSFSLKGWGVNACTFKKGRAPFKPIINK